jgi:hypothetical protein
MGVVDSTGRHFRLDSLFGLALLLHQEEMLARIVTLQLHLWRLLSLLHFSVRGWLLAHTTLFLLHSCHLLPQGLILSL